MDRMSADASGGHYIQMLFPLTLSDVAKGFVEAIAKELQGPIAKAATPAVR
ncbi:MAG: hypothetical protein ACJ8F3_04295 [Xanthobacteraceae bacterium]